MVLLFDGLWDGRRLNAMRLDWIETGLRRKHHLGRGAAAWMMARMYRQKRRRVLFLADLGGRLFHVGLETRDEPLDEVGMAPEVLVKQPGGVAFDLAGRDGVLVECRAAEQADELRRAAETAHIPQILLVERPQR